VIQDVAGSNPVGRPFKPMRIHCVQYDIAWEDKPTSHSRAEQLLAGTPPNPGDLVLLPELGDVGFSLALDRIIDDRSQKWASGIAHQYQCWLIHGWPIRGRSGRGLNVCGLFSPDGKLVGLAEKMHPFTAGHEDKAYDAGSCLQVFDVDGLQLCPLICYDLRFPEAFRQASRLSAECMTVIANWPEMRADHWRTLTIARAIENQAIVAACNRTGSDPNVRYAGGSLIVDAKGCVLAEGGEDPAVVSAEVDIAGMRAWRKAFPALADIRPDLLPEG
jgi:omega-amidase